jgi:hypothetical protein
LIEWSWDGPKSGSNLGPTSMWSPPDKNALPSPEEIKHATEAIETLEEALRDAFELLKSTKQRIATMTKDLEERKGWIAPIRKVPTEVLADILLFASEMDDMAPVNFTAVSRLWRNIILATPKAWSFIYLTWHYRMHSSHRDNRDYCDYFFNYKNTYFERSKPSLLHLNLPEITGFHPRHSNSIIKAQAHRIRCLTTFTDIFLETQSSSRCQQFPCLQTLTITDQSDGTKLDPSFFSISRFPALQTLHWPNCRPLTQASSAISPSNFPPLQHLTVDIGTLSAGLDILQCCATTLESLVLKCLGQRYPSPLIQITFPLLRCLTIGNDLYGTPPIIRAITPVLTSLVVTASDSSIPSFFDADMQKVTHMRWHSFKIPSVCIHVRVLQIMVDPYYTLKNGRCAECANKLKEIAGAYPSLERIELSSERKGYIEDLVLMQQNVEECLGKEFIKPRLLWTSRLEGDLPGHVATTVRLVFELLTQLTNCCTSVERRCLATNGRI